MSVIGSAALDKGDIAYDGIDDADLTYTQVSTLALDLVDNDLLAGMDTIDLSIVGELRLDSIDHILADIHSLRKALHDLFSSQNYRSPSSRNDSFQPCNS